MVGWGFCQTCVLPSSQTSLSIKSKSKLSKTVTSSSITQNQLFLLFNLPSSSLVNFSNSTSVNGTMGVLLFLRYCILWVSILFHPFHLGYLCLSWISKWKVCIISLWKSMEPNLLLRQIGVFFIYYPTVLCNYTVVIYIFYIHCWELFFFFFFFFLERL